MDSDDQNLLGLGQENQTDFYNSPPFKYKDGPHPLISGETL